MSIRRFIIAAAALTSLSAVAGLSKSRTAADIKHFNDAKTDLELGGPNSGAIAEMDLRQIQHPSEVPGFLELQLRADLIDDQQTLVKVKEDLASHHGPQAVIGLLAVHLRSHIPQFEVLLDQAVASADEEYLDDAVADIQRHDYKDAISTLRLIQRPKLLSTYDMTWERAYNGSDDLNIAEAAKAVSKGLCIKADKALSAIRNEGRLKDFDRLSDACSTRISPYPF